MQVFYIIRWTQNKFKRNLKLLKEIHRPHQFPPATQSTLNSLIQCQITYCGNLHDKKSIKVNSYIIDKVAKIQYAFFECKS